MRDWGTYIANTKGKSAAPSVTDAIAYVTERERALDFGCGAMSDIAVIAAAGFRHIDAVDSCKEIEMIAAEKQSHGVPVTFHQTSFNRFIFNENSYDLVNAQNALPFVGSEYIEEVMQGIKRSIRKSGVFVGTFFGPDDEWASKPDIVTHQLESIEGFFNPKEWQIHRLEEEKASRPTASGKDKNWHVFHVIASRIDTM